MHPPVEIAVAGVGLIGRRHLEHILAEPEAALAAIVDPSPAGRELAAQHKTPWYPDFAALVAAKRPDGVIFATPTQLHVADGLAAVAARIPALIEKPIAGDAAEALKLVVAAETAGIPLLIGHHRRHNPMIQKAKEIVASGRLGKLVSVHGFFWLMKPDDYFDVAWRRAAGAGPVLTNLIHDIDLMRHLVGEVASVQAMSSNAVRGFEIEETAAVLLCFTNGAIGTVNISDTIVAPWSWEQTTGENPVYPQTDQNCYTIGGTHGSLTVPKLEVWSNAGKRSWWEPLQAQRSYAAQQDPLRLQIQHFCAVVRGEAKPVVSGREGLQTLRVIQAIKAAAASGMRVEVVV